MGGKVGLKGTDGVVQQAIAKGADPVAPKRAAEFLRELKERLTGNVDLFCPPAKMGEEEAKEVGYSPEVLTMTIAKETSAKDTMTAVGLLNGKKVDLIVFVGGDGTARNIFDAMKNDDTPVLGVPAGVKMYSGIFAINPRDAAEAVATYSEHHAEVSDFEVMDADESAIRNDVFDVKLYGCLKGISIPALIQGCKEVSPETRSEAESQGAIAKYVVEELPKDATLILGPGTTVEHIAKTLGVKKTILGVDIYFQGKVILDVNEKILLEKIDDWNQTWIILSPIGHQGILLGRGNQQISPNIVKRVGKKHVLIVATLNKLGTIEARALRVDTGDAETDAMLRGDFLVITGYREGVTVPVQ
jgi:predicted polyphosphate/ATP-dependent NAD kinase